MILTWRTPRLRLDHLFDGSKQRDGMPAVRSEGGPALAQGRSSGPPNFIRTR